MPDSEGWTKRHRKVEKWEWYKNSHMVHLFGHLIGKAAHKPEKWQGQIIERGQLITGIFTLHKQTGISIQIIRTCLDRLVRTGEITRKSTNRYSIITICNYADYQNQDEAPQQTTNNQLTNNQQTTNHKQEEERIKEVKKNSKKKILKKETELIYPFDTPEFLEAWDLWKRFKKEQFRFTYKPIGEQAALKNIADLANGNLNTAIEIIHQSIKNGWQGFFAKKGGDNRNTDLTEFKKQTKEKMERIIKEHGEKTGSI